MLRALLPDRYNVIIAAEFISASCTTDRCGWIGQTARIFCAGHKPPFAFALFLFFCFLVVGFSFALCALYLKGMCAFY